MDSSRFSTVGVSVVIVVPSQGDLNSANIFSHSSLDYSSTVSIFSVENFSLCIEQSF